MTDDDDDKLYELSYIPKYLFPSTSLHLIYFKAKLNADNCSAVLDAVVDVIVDVFGCSL